MILVISNIANDYAATLVDMFPPGTAVLITASQFHQSFKTGINVDDLLGSHIVINRKAIAVSDISGVINTVTNFYQQEFYYIDPADRGYVCTELNAFIIYLLTELPCKKLNPPSVRSLTGPGVHKIEWVKTAHTLNIPVWQLKIVNGLCVNKEQPNLKICLCTVVGDELTTDNIPETVANFTRVLQRVFALPYMSCCFVCDDIGKYYLKDISFVPDITTDINRRAILNYFI